MNTKSSYQTLYLAFLVWLNITVLINCTPVNDGVRKVSASKERMMHREAAELGIIYGTIAKDARKEAQVDGHKHLQDVYSTLGKNAGKEASFHISKAEKIETPGKKVRINDQTIHRHLSESNIAAGRLAKENLKQAQKEGHDFFYKESFRGLSKFFGRMAAIHISKANKSAAPIQE